MKAAKRKAIRDRVLEWIDRAEFVELVRETPGMQRENNYVTTRWLPTGSLTIELRLDGIANMDAAMCDVNGRRDDPMNYFAK